MVLKFLISCLFIAPLSAWGFSSDRLQEYQKAAQAQKIWQHPQWLKLGHYRKNLISGYQSPLQGDFFISPSGKSDPQAELQATIATLFTEKQAQLQCRYLARTSWLKDILQIQPEDLAACPEREAWKAKLGAQEVYLVFAASDLSSAGSSFGHTFLRLHNPKNKKELELLDYGVNYAASTGEDSGAIYALKGVAGFYPGVFSMLPYYQKIREYTNLEGRDLWEYRLDLSPAEVEMMVDHLLELEGSYANYYFANDNCSQQILELLEVARPQLNVSSHFRDMTIPLDTVKLLADRGVLQQEKMRMALRGQWQAYYSLLGPAQKVIFKNFSETQKEDLIKDFTPQEKAEILEASLSYLALLEYRQQKEMRSQKYQLSVARAHLGAQTKPLEIAKPSSPLNSPDSVGFYLGGGEDNHQSFYRFKLRRAFHDLLSDDSGLTPFSHLEVGSLDFRYYPEDRKTDLYHLTLLKILSTTPVTEFETPWSWMLDIGSEPKLAPFLRLGAGWSYDLFSSTRGSFLIVSENTQLADVAEFGAGFEAMVMSKGKDWRALGGAQYLRDFKSTENIWTYTMGLSFDVLAKEVRLENKWRKEVPEWTLSIIF